MDGTDLSRPAYLGSIGEKTMLNPRHFAVASLVCCFLPAVLAQNANYDSAHTWEKTYTVSGNPSLTLNASDSNLDVHSCADCHTVHIHVISRRDLQDYRLIENQSGNNISFSLEEKLRVGFHLNWGGAAQTPQITVETPANLTLQAHTADGNLTLRDLNGNLQVHTGDGNADISNVAGTLRLTSGDGNIHIQNAKGDLEARTSDGRMKIDGRFTSIRVHTSDGRLDIALNDGTQLNAASRIESSDGSINLRVPRNLAADLDVSASDGRIDCSLPLVLDHYNSAESGPHHLRGRLSAGGVPLVIHSSDGNISIAQL
jgi:hypothetical protein